MPGPLRAAPATCTATCTPELEQQLAAHGDVPQAFQATLRALDTAFRRIHARCAQRPAAESRCAWLGRLTQSLCACSNGPVLANLSIVVTYVDAASGAAYIASNGGTRCVAGARAPDGRAAVAADVGNVGDGSSCTDDASAFSAEHVVVLPLQPSLKVLVLGSKGLWCAALPLLPRSWTTRLPAV